MADRWAVATGNWSNTATWNGGTLPTAADDVFADGFTVTIDQDVTVLSIRTTQRSGGTAGGGFSVSTNRIITANIIGGSTNCVTTSGTAALTVNGNVTGASSANRYGIDHASSGALNVTGNVTGGTNGTTHGIVVSNNGQTTIIGNVTGGSQSAAYGISIISNAVVSITGNVTGGSNTNTYGLVTNSSQTTTITGTVSGASGNTSVGASNQGGGTMSITGNVSGGGGSSSIGVSNTSSGSIVVFGNATGGSGAAAIGVSNQNIGVIRVNGTATGGAGAPGVNSSSTGTAIITGNHTSSSVGYTGAACNRLLIHASNTLQHEYRVDNAGVAGVARSLYTGGVNLNQPAVNNVRSGTVYGASNEFTGTCAVPPAGSVALGVPVDNTTGTGLINQTVLQAALEAALAPNAANIVERSTNDNKAITFSWPVSGATITGQKSIDNGAYSAVVGAITFLRTESNRHYYALAYNAADRNTVESSIRYKMTDGTYTKYFNLHVVPSGDVDVVVTPLQAVVDQMIRGTRIEVPLGYTGTVGPVVVTDTSNNPIDISAPSELIISKKWRGDILVIPDGSINRSGAGNNQFTISASGATLIPGEHAWALRRLSDKFVFAKGDWVVKQTATKD